MNTSFVYPLLLINLWLRKFFWCYSRKWWCPPFESTQIYFWLCILKHHVTIMFYLLVWLFGLWMTELITLSTIIHAHIDTVLCRPLSHRSHWRRAPTFRGPPYPLDFIYFFNILVISVMHLHIFCTIFFENP